METKICKKCGRELPINEFYKNNYSKDGYDYKCKTCLNEYRKERRHLRENTIQTSQRGIKATFKLSDFEDKMLFAELKRRGYTGELQFSKVVSL